MVESAPAIWDSGMSIGVTFPSLIDRPVGLPVSSHTKLPLFAPSAAIADLSPLSTGERSSDASAKGCSPPEKMGALHWLMPNHIRINARMTK